tara:strand:+ start:698 stop:1534 length:837 start_codon:yes stop_codon:yes gene_type:complete
MSNAVFIEYRFNPDINDYDSVTNRMLSLGFNQRSTHSVSGVELWIQSRAIVLLKPDRTFNQEGQVMGLGTLSKEHPMDYMNDIYLDEETDFYVKECDNGFKFYFTETDSLNHLYQPVSRTKVKGSGINAFTGLLLDTTNTDVLSTLHRIAEKVEDAGKYTKYIFKNKFTVFVEKKFDAGVKLLVSESSDVFATTSYMIARDVDLLDFPISVEPGKNYGGLNSMIKGYNCRAFGSEKSYSIENYIPAKDFNVDIAYRTRKQYIKIKEATLEFYDNLVSQ